MICHDNFISLAILFASGVKLSGENDPMAERGVDLHGDFVLFGSEQRSDLISDFP